MLFKSLIAALEDFLIMTMLFPVCCKATQFAILHIKSDFTCHILVFKCDILPSQCIGKYMLKILFRKQKGTQCAISRPIISVELAFGQVCSKSIFSQLTNPSPESWPQGGSVDRLCRILICYKAGNLT